MAIRVQRSAHLREPEQLGKSESSQHKFTRRQFLKGIGMGGAVVGVGGLSVLTWRVSSQGVFEAGHGDAYSA
jgi:hypothetical protein